MSILNLFKKLKPATAKPVFAPNRCIEQEAMLKIIMESQAQTILDIINESSELNGITSKKLWDYWVNYEFICYSNDNFKIIIDDIEYPEYRFTPQLLAEFTLKSLAGCEAIGTDIIGIVATLSSALDAVCVKYSELTDLCGYLAENNLRVRKA